MNSRGVRGNGNDANPRDVPGVPRCRAQASSALRVVTQHLDPSKRDQVAALPSKIQAAIAAAPGLQHRFAGRGDNGHALVATLWDTREHAEPGVPLGQLWGKLVAVRWMHGDPQVTDVFIESEAPVPA